jgi:hypothetical protein
MQFQNLLGTTKLPPRANRPPRPLHHHELFRTVTLEFILRLIILLSCRFTSFIAKSATKTAKSWSGPATGKGPGARIAARRSFPRSSRYSPPRSAMAAPARCLPAAIHQLPVPLAGAVVAVVRIGIDGVDRPAADYFRAAGGVRSFEPNRWECQNPILARRNSSPVCRQPSP